MSLAELTYYAEQLKANGVPDQVIAQAAGYRGKNHRRSVEEFLIQKHGPRKVQQLEQRIAGLRKLAEQSVVPPMDTLTADEFKSKYVSSDAHLKKLWDIGHSATAHLQLALIDINTKWSQTKLADAAPHEWAIFDVHNRSQPGGFNWEGCLFYNFYGECHPTREHANERHFCFYCHGAHAALGHFERKVAGECPSITTDRELLTALAGRMGVSLRTVLKLFGLLSPMPTARSDSIAVTPKANQGPLPSLGVASASHVTEWAREAAHGALVAVAVQLGRADAATPPLQCEEFDEVSSNASTFPARVMTLRDRDSVLLPQGSLSDKFSSWHSEITTECYCPSDVGDTLIQERGEDVSVSDAIRDLKERLRITKLHPDGMHKALNHFPPTWEACQPWGDPLILWCECDLCCKGEKGASLHPVFKGWMARCENDLERPRKLVRVAVKVFSAADVKRFDAKVYALRKLRELPHPPSVPLAGYGQYVRDPGEERYFVATVERNGDLASFLDSEGQDLGQSLEVARGIARCLSACHKAGVCHRDLTPQNVLVTTGGGSGDEEPAVELCDFENAIDIDYNPSATEALYTPLWTYPGARKKNDWCAADRFSLGLIIYEILRNAEAVALPMKKEEAEARQRLLQEHRRV
eukprot:CAMPEP_0174881498 /NCGR_PEP_ID=MMETSP1114-20130205/84292_1 /TAXON_ID=312471 /ORGANISM="Neobodo designis, Strain CCAP 1951/1" /LENGTH=638 /DNA_ID=CAMNT_0016116895 /DNA_START=42 /DNA_END=1955 /DNA_ORIENTATION=+